MEYWELCIELIVLAVLVLVFLANGHPQQPKEDGYQYVYDDGSRKMAAE